MHLSEDTRVRLTTLLEGLDDYQEAEERLLRHAATSPGPDSPFAHHQHRKTILALQQIQSDRASTSDMRRALLKLARRQVERPERPDPAASWGRLPQDVLDIPLF